MHYSIPPLLRAPTFTTRSRLKGGAKAVSKKHQPKENPHRLDGSKKSRDKTSSRDKIEDDLSHPQMKRVETFASEPEQREEDLRHRDESREREHNEKVRKYMEASHKKIADDYTFESEPEQREEDLRHRDESSEREHNEKVRKYMEASHRKIADDYYFRIRTRAARRRSTA
jgi:hypothetical protein